MRGYVVCVSIALLLLCTIGAADADAGGKKYAVVVSEKTLADGDWAKVVEQLEKKYDGKRFVYKHPDVSAVRESLSEYMPHYVCIVAKPEEATSELIRQSRRTITWLDDDPYEDALWAILTGYSVEDAMRIATAEPLTITRGLSHIIDGWLDWFEEGLAFSEIEKNAKYVKKPGGVSEKVKGPDDTTEEVVAALNSNKYHIMSSSGHATQANWMMGYSYRSGRIISRAGSLFGTDSSGKQYEIKTTNPKIYYSPGNCLIAHASHPDCMVLAWIHSGVNQFFGHIVTQGRICTAWSISDYFFGLQDRFTYAEAIYISRQVAHSFVIDGVLDGRTQKSYRRCLDGTVLYGDPAWAARMKKTTVPYYDQELDVEKREDGKYKITFRIKANCDIAFSHEHYDGPFAFLPANAARDVLFSHRHHGGPFTFLPFRVKNVKVESADGCKLVVADNFLLMRMDGKDAAKIKKDNEWSVVVVAEPLDQWACPPDKALPVAREDQVAMRRRAVRFLQCKNYKAAIKAYEPILRHNSKDPDALYNTACAYSLLGEKGQAVAFLERAVKTGIMDIDHVIGDSDFDGICEEKGYKRLIRELEEKEAGTMNTEVMPETARGYLPRDANVFEPVVVQVGQDEQTPEQQIRTPAGMALVAGKQYVADEKANKIFEICPKTGKKIGEVPAPSGNIAGIAAFDKYLLVADANDKTVYLITTDGHVILYVTLDSVPLGISSNGDRFWVFDTQLKRREFKIDRTRKIHLSQKRTATIVYQAGRGPEGYIAVPWNMTRQKILGKALISSPSSVEKDNWGQPAVKSKKLKVVAEIYDVQYYVWPDKVGCLDDIPEEIAGRYLVDGRVLKIHDPAIQEAKKWITRDGKEKNCYQLVQRAYQYATEHAHYENCGGWVAAPELLEKGIGTCSPLTFLYMSLCRASGVPARFQAATRYRDKDPSLDTDFHRWSEVYLPGYGWIPVESPAVGKDPTPAKRALRFGHVPNTDLIMTIGGGDSTFFGWGYNASNYNSNSGSCTARWSGVKVE